MINETGKTKKEVFNSLKILQLIKKGGTGSINVFDLGQISYGEAFQLQLGLFEFIKENDLPGTLLLLEHPPIITIGSNRSTENLLVKKDSLSKKGIDIVQSNRGGDITLHAPGQLICYPVFNLKYFKKDLSLFVHNLEEVIIETLNAYGISSSRVKKHRGVFTGTKKIASIGLKIRKWITLHGLSLNININLSYFDNIVACGLKDFPQTSISEILGKDIPINNVKELMQKSFENIFNIPFDKIQE
jgi:lipoyl(octanoyl) transferase